MNLILPTISPERTYVALATLLPCSLRAHASSANLCFFQVVDHATHAERLFVRVAALPHRLDTLDSARVFTLCLTTRQLAQALPWDQTLQDKATCDVRELVDQGTALEAACRIIILEDQLQEALRLNQRNDSHT